MRKIYVRRLGVMSVGQFMGMATAIWVFVVGIFTVFGGLAAVLGQDQWSVIQKVFATLGTVLFSLVVLPLLGFAWGWLYGVATSFVTNLFLDSSKGVELTVEDENVGPVEETEAVQKKQ